MTPFTFARTVGTLAAHTVGRITAFSSSSSLRSTSRKRTLSLSRGKNALLVSSHRSLSRAFVAVATRAWLLFLPPTRPELADGARGKYGHAHVAAHSPCVPAPHGALPSMAMSPALVPPPPPTPPAPLPLLLPPVHFLTKNRWSYVWSPAWPNPKSVMPSKRWL